jgi:hypothetical protein
MLATEIWGTDITSEAIHRDLEKKSSKNSQKKKNSDKRFDFPMIYRSTLYSQLE